MTFLTSIILGLAMGSGTVFSIRFGQKDMAGLKEGILASFVLLGAVTVVLNILVFAGTDWIIRALQTPEELVGMMHDYLIIIFAGLIATFLYNFFAFLLRSLGNSVTPLLFLAVSAALNIVLDLWFVAGLGFGVAGAAAATVIAQYVSGIGIAVYTFFKAPGLVRPEKGTRLRWERMKEIANFSALTCLQQSIMNLGILAVQGLVNSFGTTVMAAFAAAVKIDAFAYLPVQDFGNAFSIFIAQNFGAGEKGRIKKGIRVAAAASVGFGLFISLLVFVFAEPLMGLFIDRSETAVIAEGVRYLRIEGAFYCLIGVLFLLYGPLPRPRPSGDVGRTDGCIPRDPGRARLCAGGGPRFRGHRHLVVGADRLAAGGCPRGRVLPHPAEKTHLIKALRQFTAGGLSLSKKSFLSIIWVLRNASLSVAKLWSTSEVR